MEFAVTRDSSAGGPTDNAAQVLSFATAGSVTEPLQSAGTISGNLKTGLTLTDQSNGGSSFYDVSGTFGSNFSYVIALSGSQFELQSPVQAGGFAGYSMFLSQNNTVILENPAGFGAATEIYRDGPLDPVSEMEVSSNAAISVNQLDSGSRTAAAHTDWIGGSGVYSDAAHWNNGLPQIVDIKDTKISVASPVTVTLDRGGVARNLTLTAGNTLELNGYGLTLSGRLENQGIVNVNGTLALLFNSRIESVGASTAPGVINLVNSSGVILAKGDLTIENTQTINMALQTQINSGGTLTNAGLIEGSLGIMSIAAETSVVNIGTIRVDGAGMSFHTPAIVNDGTIEMTGSGANVTLNPAGLPVQTITGSGDWIVGSGINVLGKVDFTTTGDFTLAPGAIVGTTNSVTAGSSYAIPTLAGGSLGIFYGNSSTLTITEGDATKPFDGQLDGSLQLTKNGSGTQILKGPVTTTGGTIINGGTLQVNDPVSALGYDPVQVNAGGTLAGVGSISAFTRINSGATLAPGNSVPGELSMFALRLPAGSTLDVDLSNTGPSDVAHVYAGTTHVGGVTLNITDVGLTAGETAWFLEYENTIIADAAGNLTGIIDASNFILGELPENIQGYLVAERNGTSGVVAGRVGFFVDAVLADADFDSDFDVDGDDLVKWQEGYGDATAGRIDGDANGDQLTDGADFLIWQRQVTEEIFESASAVPEPSAIALLAACGLAFTAHAASRRRCRNSSR